MDEFASLDNELMSAEQADLPVEEETYNGNREYDPGPNDGKYGYIEVEQDGVMMQCTNAYTSKAYGGQYCVGDTYTTPNGGTQPIRAIGVHGIETAPATWDAEETYADVGEKLGMSLEEWTEFSAEIQQLNETVDGLKGNMFGPTEQERGRLGIRISQENPDWTEAEVMAEADRILEEKWMTSDAYREAALAETALFEKYGITKPNPAVYGTGIWQDEDGKYFRFESNQGHLWQTSQDDGFLDYAVPIGIGIGIGVITGGLGGALGTGSLGTVAGGAVNGVISSAIGQAAVTGGIDPSSLLQAAILGGIGGLADAAVGGKLPPGMDEAVWDIADTLNMEYAEVIDLIEGVATGVVSGDSLEEIALGAVGNWGTEQIKDWVKNALGDEFEVDDWFKDGASTIPTEALDPLIEGTINAAIAGGMSAEDAIGMAWDYFQAGGDVDFLLPDSPEFKSWLEGLDGLDIDISKGDDWSYTTNEDGSIDITWNLPSWDFDFNLPDGVDLAIGNPCTSAEGQEGTLIGGSLEGQWICDPTVPDVVECMEGFEWSDLYNECVEIDIPDIVECMEGFDWDGQQCVPTDFLAEGTDCEDGFHWDSLLGQCVEIDIPSVDPTGCGPGETWDEVLGQCIPDIVECMEGFEWDGQTCVEIPDIIECMEGFEWDGQTCVEMPDIVECLPGFDWDGQTCVQVDFEIPEWELPEWEAPELDIELPDLPDAPEVTAQATTTKPYKTSRTEQFAYSPFNVYKPVAREDLSGITLPSPGKGLFK